MPRRKVRFYCSFCRRDDRQVEKLIGGPGVYICDACVAACNVILEGGKPPDFAGFHTLDEDALLATLRPSLTIVEQVREVLQQHVDLLRGRGVSWERIGLALGTSRQAAWERFS